MLANFKEFNDPRIYRYMKIGFGALIVTAALLTLIALSEPVRDTIGLSDNSPVTRNAQEREQQKPVRGHKSPSPGLTAPTASNPTPAPVSSDQEAPSGGSTGAGNPSNPQGPDPSPVPSPPTTPSPSPSPIIVNPPPVVILPEPSAAEQPKGLLPTTTGVVEGVLEGVGKTGTGLTEGINKAVGGNP